MSSDWQTFLKNIAVAKCLAPEQTETLLQKFPSPHETNTQTKVGMELGIEGSSVQARLAEIYTKFGISGKGTKTQKLQTILQTEFHQSSQPQVAEATTAAISLEQMKRSCYDLLERQKRLSTNALMAKDGIEFKPDDLFVPLGLVERRKRPRRRDIESSDQGSQLYGATEEEVTQTFQHQDFFEQVIREGNTPKSHGQRLAITGEPGAGKTTLLQRIGDWLRAHDQVPIWISLANVGAKPLREYLLEDWLRDAAGATDAAAPDWKATLEQLLKAGQVCLLLDGVDEMTIPQALRWIGEQLGEGWAASVRVVLTCRLNVWESAALPGFDVYRSLAFDYPDQVEQFIDQFFQREGACPALGQALKEELEQPGKERICDSVKNPLRLSLLCYTWELGVGELPDTKAELYRQFVEAFYTLKQREFPILPNEQETLNQALGELAREAIDQNDSRFRLRESFIQRFLPGHPQQEGSLFWQAARIGWLNHIGITADKPYEKAYSFWHPTFQEYFAVYSIQNWGYFLHHNNQVPNPLRHHAGKPCVYRIFQIQWAELIPLWFGRKDVSSSERESFISVLIEFNDGCRDIFSRKAYFLAAACTSEFASSRTQEIILELADHGLHWRKDQDFWNENLISCYQGLHSAKALTSARREDVIKLLESKLANTKTASKYEDYIRLHEANLLQDVSPENKRAQEIILEFAEKAENDAALGLIMISNLVKISPESAEAKDALLKIAKYNENSFAATMALIHFLESHYEDGGVGFLTQDLEKRQPNFVLFQIIRYVHKKDPGNQKIIRKIIELLDSCEEHIIEEIFYLFESKSFLENPEILNVLKKIVEDDEYELDGDGKGFRYEIAVISLGKVGIVDDKIESSLKLISREHWDERQRCQALFALFEMRSITQDEFSETLFNFLYSFQDASARWEVAEKLAELHPNDWRVPEQVIDWMLNPVRSWDTAFLTLVRCSSSNL
ncbi:NACHT domain-containing protein [Leptolyngbya iicbica LK]|uniref:NACHT domain-containing protein n=2 Tax=Cyanophyceae TaxID=3028117 RepID=A0A4Q7E3H7_9CYAN|nr:AAA family ATPase [Leptolyngbya sp. LK]RZM76562.1 NACHT domain-containing protein [Leptolyngbya sp. LK]